jgi:hypothetical protein
LYSQKKLYLFATELRIICCTFAADGYTEFLHIASERGLRDGSLPVAGILHRRGAARIRAAEVLCQLSFAE